MKQDMKLTKETYDSLLIVKEGLEFFDGRMHIMISNLNALTSNLEQSIVNESNDKTASVEERLSKLERIMLEKLSEHDMKILKETLNDLEMIKDGLGYFDLRMNRTISSLDTMYTEKPSVFQELEETLDSIRSEQVEVETPKSLRLTRIERLLGIDNDDEDDIQYTHLSETPAPIISEHRISKVEQQILMIQNKQDQLMIQLGILTTRLDDED